MQHRRAPLFFGYKDPSKEGERRSLLVMGLLDHLWDDTVAGPRPESGLGRLRKYKSFSPSSSSSVAGAAARAVAGMHEGIAVTRSITILRTSPRIESPDSDSAPDSPSSAPDSPLTPTTPRGEWRRLWRRRAAAENLETAEHRSPTAYDWVVISALDK